MENKSILMSIRPQYVAKILNGEKTIEARKKFPKDYVGWVYIYCTKGKLPIMEYINRGVHSIITDNKFDKNFKYYLNGKVVARFWCDKVEEIFFQIHFNGNALETDYMSMSQLLKSSCLTKQELGEYLCPNKEGEFEVGKTYGYAIHISKLEVFDKPKELKEFYKVGAWKVFEEQFDSSYLKKEQQEIMEDLGQVITKAPQSYMFVEDK